MVLRMGIEGLIAAGAVAGVLASLFPSTKGGCAVLLLIPLAMLVHVHLDLADPSRRPDALDALLYVFGPLWPSLGALGGFLTGRTARAWAFSRRERGD
jgi:hypothetical protein